ncbi:hypothetical protein BCS89_10780 [Vibrio splendidus]|nr:hypothetical protein BCS97_10515 [Vibrio splendidus]PMP27093.1 hypothetical protein BCS89_10780 [Vibrio splendidus]PMP36016.1 hypothetical protein BCS88_07285 [Vibrio splendidus]PMP47461.1 hypothetical protein BCS87_00450 [Vibrio splendidus]PMP48985.1 hypothetical protein BCS85_08470 [Vibrio splendidus]
MIHGEVTIPVPIGPGTSVQARTRYLRIWKENKQWKSELFTNKNKTRYNDFVKWSRSNKLPRNSYNYHKNGQTISLAMGAYKFNISNYKATPRVSQSSHGVSSGLIGGYFSYPYSSFSQSDRAISLESYVTDQGQAGLSLSVPYDDKFARLSFVKNTHQIEGIKALEASASVSVTKKGSLTQVNVDHSDRVVSYFFNTQTWIDHHSGVKNPNGSGWKTAPYQADYLSAIGQCERLKDTVEPTCSPIITLDYGRDANPDSFPHLSGWRDSTQTVKHHYKKMGGVLAIINSDNVPRDNTQPQKSNYTYSLNSKGQPTSVREENTFDPLTRVRTVTSYLTHGSYAGLANNITRFGILDNAEYRLSNTATEWHLASTGHAQKSRVVESVYAEDGSLSQEVTTENDYDDQDRLEKRLTITSNGEGQQIEEEVEYQYANDYLIGKIEKRSIVSPAYENGVSDLLVKEFEYKYDNDKLIEQLTHQGRYETRDHVIQDNQDRVISRRRTVNGKLVLDEKIVYQGDDIIQRCENNNCIDYQYQTTSKGRLEKSLINGIVYDETQYDDKHRITSKTVRGITKETQYYPINEAPAQLQEWLSVCPTDTTFVTYYSLPESVTCTSTRGEYNIRKGLNDRFIITGETRDNGNANLITLPHFEGESAVIHTVTGDLDRQNIEYDVNGQVKKRSDVLKNLTETYDQWGNVVRRYYDITGLLYQVEDHLGNQVTFTYNADGKITSSELNGNSATKITHKYDERGLRTDTSDPSRGHWQYHYNVNNQLEWQQDANGDRSVFSYDQLNRITQLNTANSTICYQYPTELPLSEPSQVVQVAGNHNDCSGHSVQYREDNTYQWPNGWLKQRDITLEDGKTQSTYYDYDLNGQVIKESTSSRLGHSFAIETAFKNGAAYKWSNAETGRVYKEILSEDAQQRPTHVRFGNGIEEFYQYDRVSGQVTQQSAARNGLLVYQFDYQYDLDDKLTRRLRHFYYKNRSETSFEDEYGYDDNGRLASHEIKQFCINGVCQNIDAGNYISAVAEYEYDQYGNITYKKGVGQYYYESDDPFKLTRLEEENGENRDFSYDLNGNLLSDGVREFEYQSNRLVHVARHDSQDNNIVERDETRFTYGPDGQQIVRTDKRFDIATLEWATTKTLSTGAYSYTQKEGESSAQESFGGNGFSVSCNGSLCGTAYSHSDRLGQRIMVTGSEGDITSQTFTDPFGATHNILLPEMDDAFAVSTAYGSMFGHVGVAGFDLIHMKGRVYDPYLARFIQADPFVKGQEFVPNYNRYSFKQNDPLNAVDPSGYWSFKKFVKRTKKKIQKIAKRAESKIRNEAKRVESKVRNEAKRAESQIRNEAKRAESNVRNEVKRVESRVRNEAKRIESQIRHESKRFERRIRHEVGRWESDVRHGVKIVGMMIKENPEMVLAMLAAAWVVGPAALAYFQTAIPALLGTTGAVAGSLSAVMTQTLTAMAAGAVTGGATHLIANKGNLKGIEKSILMGAVTGGIANGIAHGVMESQVMVDLLGNDTLLQSVANIGVKSAAYAGADNLIYGRDFSDALLANILTTAANSQIGQHMSDLSTTLQSFVAAVAGGIITTEIYGGDFATNAASGFIRSYIDYTSNELGGNLFDGDITEALELTMDFIPVVSNLKAAYESTTGTTIFSGHEISSTERGLIAAAIFLGPAAKVAIRGGKIAQVTIRHSDDAVDLLTSSSNVSGVANRLAKSGEIFYKTTKEATEAAKKLGFEKTKFKTHNETVFYNKKKKFYMSRDVGSGDGNGAHNGGVWKMAKSVKDLGSKKTRLGTYDANLNKIGD